MHTLKFMLTVTDTLAEIQVFLLNSLYTIIITHFNIVFVQLSSKYNFTIAMTVILESINLWGTITNLVIGMVSIC